jgi:hypothetical protein
LLKEPAVGPQLEQALHERRGLDGAARVAVIDRQAEKVLRIPRLKQRSGQ